MRKVIIGVGLVLWTIGGVGVLPAHPETAAPATRIEVLPVPSTAAVHAASEPGVATPYTLSHLALEWSGAADAVVRARWETADGWQPWVTADVNVDMMQGEAGTVYSNLVRADGADRVDTEVVGGAVSDLRIVAIDTIDGRRDVVPAGRVAAAAVNSTTTSTTERDPGGGPDPTTTIGIGSTSTTSTTAASKQATKLVPEPPVVTRAEWGADESMRSGTPQFAPITKLIVHHTDTANDDPDPASTVRAIYAYHTQTRGWNDIGYNFLIDEAGRVYEGRYARDYDTDEEPTGEDVNDQGVIGAHALNANTGSVGVALLGTFDGQQPTAAAMDSLEDLLAWKADRHAIDAFGNTPFHMGDGSTRSFGNVSGHRDSSSTACPGDQLYALLPTVRQAVDNRIAAAHGTTKGYWLASRNGQVYPFGQAQPFGSMAGRGLNAPIGGIASTVTGKGYWLLGGDGGIFSFGDAAFYGSTGGMVLNKPVVGLEPTPTGKGYWLVASDGGIFAYGDAAFFGSTGSLKLNKPIVGVAATGSGKGYWLVASDGGIFAFGDATFYGSTGSISLNSPIVAMAGTTTPGGGYWMVARDGGIFAFNVLFKGSVPGLRLSSYAGSVDMQPTADGRGYYVLGNDGGVFNFGNANFLGARGGLSGSAAAAGMAVLPADTGSGVPAS